MDIPPLKSLKILLIGEYCRDRYLFGTVDRVSPEAPVPIFKSAETTETEGMGGNVGKNLEALGNKVVFIHNEEPIKKTRVIDKRYNQQLLRIDDEDIPLKPCKPSYLPDFTKYDGIVVSDYDKGFLPLGVLADLTNEAWLCNVPIFLDTKKSYLGGVQNAFVKMNEPEYARLRTASHCTSNEYIITKGDKGAEWKGKMYPTKKVNLFDPTGAGDTFLSAFATSYLRNPMLKDTERIEKAIYFANSCAAVSVTKLGCYAVKPEEIHE